MKKILSMVLLLLLLAALALPAYASGEGSRLVDDADLLSRSEARELEEKLDDISRQGELDVVIVTVDSLDGYSARDYADDYFDYNGYGMGPGRDGILLLVAMDDREWHISTRGYGITAFTDAGLSYMEDHIVPELSEGDYYEAFVIYAELCDDFVRHARAGNPYDWDNLPKEDFNPVSTLLICVIIGFVAAFIVTAVMKGQMRSVRSKAGANDYVKSGSLVLTQARDIFLYSNVSRTPRPKSNSGGSSTHSSSSGASHGGRGGSF